MREEQIGLQSFSLAPNIPLMELLVVILIRWVFVLSTWELTLIEFGSPHDSDDDVVVSLNPTLHLYIRAMPDTWCHGDTLNSTRGYCSSITKR